MLTLRALLFYLLMMVATVVCSLFSLVFASWMPFRQRFHVVVMANRFYIFALRWVCGIRYQVRGLENLPKDRPFVLLANHQSEWETIYLQLLIQPLSTVLKRELLRIPFFGWALALLRPIAIDRSKRAGALKQLLAKGKNRLGEGIPVMIFPQGTRVPYGELGKFNKGGAMLACSAGVPIVPLCHNAGAHWPSGQLIKYPGLVEVEIGEPIETLDTDVNSVHQSSTEWIQQRLQQQCSDAVEAKS
ncbi:1-acyl-sn-glycerol-3-phosphate acyltransferase [Motiliproteus coralliicola]|uniref:1-acyl-sn-glycerol-3-phosphate acyltransferase n=1 Tax=Motiliproteus coralliicola TaxID=2283196 RepID=A0A369WB05_9GAMM|nr:lysophospholipid acyltransferase family protein [Motiliproteus coralliicola]RDE18483.1 1-acyl-sn-glycerol-3-phosphate acyltransferase [Motiliproteus coralliicola]